MTKTTRQIIFFLFVFIFLTASPTILIYALGYQLNWQDWHLQKTGSLIVETEPKGARIFLDNQPQASVWQSLWNPKNNFARTPAKLKNIKPNLYNIRLELDGYWPWEKQLAIEPNQSTFIENVRLFAKSLPLLLNQQDSSAIKKVAWSNNGQYQATWSQTGLILVDLANKKTAQLQTATPTSTLLAWSPNSQKLLAGQEIYNLDQLTAPLSLAGLMSSQTKLARWHNNETIYYADNAKVYSLDIANKKNKLLATIGSGQITDLLIKDGSLYVLTKTARSADLQIFSLSDNQEPASRLTLPLISDYTFLNPDSSWLNIYEPKNQQLYLLALNKELTGQEYLEKIPARHSQWSADQKLLYATQFEIWIWQPDSKQNTLLTRVSEPINFVSWHSNDNYIVYATNQGLFTLELDDRDRHHIIQLLDSGPLNYPFLNNHGDRFYFYGQSGQESGLFQLLI